MASYTINDETYNSFEELAKNAYRKERGYLLALTKRRDKFLNDPDESVRSAAELIKRHDQWDISNEDFMFETILTHSFIQFMLTIYIHIHIRHMDCRDISNNFSAVVNANIDPDDAERWGDKPKKKPYSEYTDDEKMACISWLVDQGYTEDLRTDQNDLVRHIAHMMTWYTEADRNDKSPEIRIEAYTALWFTHDAIEDEDRRIRLAAYKYGWFDRETVADAIYDVQRQVRYAWYQYIWHCNRGCSDENRKIRLETYRALWYTKDALEDEDKEIREEAQLYYDTVGKRADE